MAKLIGDKRRVHACHGAHGSVRVATGVLPARPDLEFCRRLQRFFAGYASRYGLSLRNIVIFFVPSSGFSTRLLSCTRCEPIYSIFNPLRSGHVGGALYVGGVLQSNNLDARRALCPQVFVTVARTGCD